MYEIKTGSLMKRLIDESALGSLQTEVHREVDLAKLEAVASINKLLLEHGSYGTNHLLVLEKTNPSPDRVLSLERCSPVYIGEWHYAEEFDLNDIENSMKEHVIEAANNMIEEFKSIITALK